MIQNLDSTTPGAGQDIHEIGASSDLVFLQDRVSLRQERGGRSRGSGLDLLHPTRHAAAGDGLARLREFDQRPEFVEVRYQP